MGAALSAEGANPVFMEFAWQGQHFTCVTTADSPFHQAPVLVELNDIPQPFCTRGAGNHDHIGHIAWPNTTADRQLDSFQQPAFPPFTFQPLHRDFWQATLCIAATTASANRNLPDYEALRFQRTILILVHSFRSIPICGRHLIQ
jgi:hypothetical protein